MFARPLVSDGGLNRQLNVGDLVSTQEPPIPATDTTNTTLSYTPAMMLVNTYVRNPAGVSTDTFPTADALISALSQGAGLNGLQNGMSFRWRILNLSANLLTGAVTANTGATMVRGNVLASTTKDFLIQITNGTPLNTAINISSTNASAVLSGFTAAQLALLSQGQVVTNAIAGQQGNTILGINYAAGTVTMSGNSNTTAAGQSFTFSPTYTITGLAA